MTKRQLKNVISLQMAMTKKVVSFFQEINRVTPSFAAPGDTNPSGATADRHHSSDVTHATKDLSASSLPCIEILLGPTATNP